MAAHNKVLQCGFVTPGHIPVWVTDGVVQDSGVPISDFGALPMLVSALPLALDNPGLRTMVSDATATTFASVVSGGGSNTVPVYSDGTNWRIG